MKKMAPEIKHDLFDLSGRVAIVTGGQRGIGKAIAFGLADCGAHVALVDIAAEADGRSTARNIRNAAGVDSVYINADISRPDAIRQMVETVLAHFGSIDILCNNAGIARGGPLVSMADKPIQDLLQVNLIGVVNACRQVGKIFLQQRRGNVINIASTDGEAGTVNGAVYSATKGGVIALTRALAIEWAPWNVRVNAISPQVVQTEMTKRRLSKDGEHEKDVSRIPLGRLLLAEDLQGAAIFLASDASAMVTGHILHVDGGYLAA